MRSDGIQIDFRRATSKVVSTITLGRRRLIALIGSSGSGKTALCLNVLADSSARVLSPKALPKPPRIRPTIFQNINLSGLAPVLSMFPEYVLHRTARRLGEFFELDSLLIEAELGCSLQHCPRCHAVVTSFDAASRVAEALDRLDNAQVLSKLQLIGVAVDISKGLPSTNQASEKPAFYAELQEQLRILSTQNFRRYLFGDQLVRLDLDPPPSTKVESKQMAEIGNESVFPLEELKRLLGDAAGLPKNNNAERGNRKKKNTKSRVALKSHQARELPLVGVLVDSFDRDSLTRERLLEAMERALSLGTGAGVVVSIDRQTHGVKQLVKFGEGFWCENCEQLFNPGQVVKKLGGLVHNEILDLPFPRLAEFLESVRKQIQEQVSSVADSALKSTPHAHQLRSLESTCRNLISLGFTEHSLSTSFADLSFGERFKAQLAALLRHPLCETLFIVDGFEGAFHAQDRKQIRAAFAQIRDLGNTVLITESRAEDVGDVDTVIELTPAGDIRYQGALKDWKPHSQVRSAPTQRVTQAKTKASASSAAVTVAWPFRRATHSVSRVFQIPTGKVVALTGPSGVGKTTLLRDVLLPHASGKRSKKFKSRTSRNAVSSPPMWSTHVAVTGTFSTKKALFLPGVEDEEKPVKLGLETLAEYLGIDVEIAKLFARQGEARRLGLTESDFTLASTGTGRCPTCRGLGRVAVDYGVLGTTFETCRTCFGNQFRGDVFSTLVNGSNVLQVYQRSMRDLLMILPQSAPVVTAIRVLEEFGLRHSIVGERVRDLSRSKLSRLRLAKLFLRKQKISSLLLLLDQPFIGLSDEEVAVAIDRLKTVTNEGGTVVFSTHSDTAIRLSDAVVEMSNEN